MTLIVVRWIETRLVGIGIKEAFDYEREQSKTKQRRAGAAESGSDYWSSGSTSVRNGCEEELKVGQRQVEAGGVRLRKIIKTEVVNQPVEVQREEIVIERVPPGEAHPHTQKAFTEQEVYIPLRREEAVVEKQVRLREEVRARKRKTTDQQQVSGEVRREEVEIQEEGEARRGHTGGPRTPAREIREREEQPRSQRRNTT
jgi:uncharacterized protein (TIGR02271 family)